MKTIKTFPKELQRHTIRDMDKEFVRIFLLTFLTLVPFTWYMSQLPVKTFSGDDLVNHIAGIYRQTYRVTIPKNTPLLSKLGNDLDDTDLVEKVKPNVSDIIHPVATEAFVESDKNQKKNNRRRSGSRIEKLSNKREQVREAAKNLHRLAAPTARGGRNRSVRSEQYGEFGLTPNSKKNYDLKAFSGIVDSKSTSSKVKDTHIVEPITDDVDEIDISYIRSLTDDDFVMMFEDAVPNISQEPLYSRNPVTNNSSRNSASISDIVLKNQNQIKYCFWTQKRLDSALNGRIVVEFIIDPSGKVISVKITQSKWTNQSAGLKVERSIKNIISGWRFPAIKGDSGNFTAGATYIFD